MIGARLKSLAGASSGGNLLHTFDGVNDASTASKYGYSVAVSELYSVVTDYEAPTKVAGGQAYVYSNETGILLWTLNNPNAYSTTNDDQFGWSMALTDTHLIIGARFEDDVGGLSSGKAYIFNPATGALLWTLDNPNYLDTSSADFFGRSVALSSSYAIVGARGDVGLTGSDGTAYIFSLSTGALVLTIPNPDEYALDTTDYFGWSVALTENYAIVGAPNETNQAGKVYIFSATTGAYIRTLVNPLGGTSQFGSYVAAYGTYVACSAPVYSVFAGQVFLFNLSTGVLISELIDPLRYGGARFGAHIDINSTHTLVGAPYQNTEVSLDGGTAHLYDNATGAYVREIVNHDPIGSSTDYFGWSVAASENYIAVGAPYESSSTKEQAGVVYIFDSTFNLLHTIQNPVAGRINFGSILEMNDAYTVVNQTTTTGGAVYVYSNVTGALQYYIDNPNVETTILTDSFGDSIAVTDSYLAVGAPYEDLGFTNAGVVYVFDLATGNLLWTLANPDADANATASYFGEKGTIAAYGTNLVVGARYENAGSGVAYVFNMSTGALRYTLTNRNEQTYSAYDQFGISVAISASFIAIGTPREDYSLDDDSGKVYLYSASTGAYIRTIVNPSGYGTRNGDNFGHKVEMVGSILALSAPYEDESSTVNDAGKVYLYNTSGTKLANTNNNSTWINQYGGRHNDNFGAITAMNSSYVFVALDRAGDEKTNRTGYSGKVLVYSAGTGAYVTTIDNPDSANFFGDPDNFGETVGLSESFTLISSVQEDGYWPNAGKAYLYDN